MRLGHLKSIGEYAVEKISRLRGLVGGRVGFLCGQVGPKKHCKISFWEVQGLRRQKKIKLC